MQSAAIRCRFLLGLVQVWDNFGLVLKPRALKGDFGVLWGVWGTLGAHGFDFRGSGRALGSRFGIFLVLCWM